MPVKSLFDEVRVYAGVAERTGVQLERDVVRRSGRYCRSVSELIRKAREAGDGYYYLPLDVWPADRDHIDLQKPWVVISSSTGPDVSE
jgi:hypothetical protein